jgi:hypothetical protein
MTRREIERTVEDLEDESPGTNPLVEGVRRQAAAFDTGGCVLREGEREKLEEAGYELRQIESEQYADLELVDLSDDAEAFVDELRDGLDMDEIREKLDDDDDS